MNTPVWAKRKMLTIITPALRRAHSRKIWEVKFNCEDTKDGFGRIYCELRSQADNAAKRLNDEHRQATAEYTAAVARGVSFYDMPAHPGPDPQPEITALEFAGTVRQMLIQALEHNA